MSGSQSSAADQGVQSRAGLRTLATSVLALAGLAALAGLLVHAYTGSYSRLLADDFCTFGRMRSLGFFGSQLDWYTSWSGRFAFTASTNLVHLLGPMTPRLLPFLVILLWLAGVAGIVFGQFRRQKENGWLRAAVAGVTLPLATISLSPSIYPILYWQTGLLTYVLPLALLSVWGAWMSLDRGQIAKSSSWWRPLLAFLGPVWIAGYSETIGLTLVAGLALITARAFVDRSVSDAWKRTWVRATAGALLGLALVVVAPGNAVRQSLFPAPDPVLVVVGRGLQDAYLFSVRLVRRYSAPLALLFAAGLSLPLFSTGDPKHRRISWVELLLVPAAAFALVATVMTPSEYALASFPDDRVLITATAVVGGAVLCWSWRLGEWLRRLIFPMGWLRSATAVLAAAAAALAFVVATNAISTDQQILTDARDYARRWDERHQQVIEAAASGVQSMEVASLTHMGGLAEVERDPDTWINRCIAETYGLRQVRPK